MGADDMNGSRQPRGRKRLLAPKLWAVVLASLTLAGCGGQGDFGRDSPNLLATRIGMNAYSAIPGYENGHTGRAAFTAAETDLRRYADALTRTYAHQKTYGNFSRLPKIIPRKIRAGVNAKVPIGNYAAEINRIGFTSAEARLNAIIDDIRSDGRNIDGFWSAVVRVYRSDRSRAGEIDAGGIRPAVAGDILRRIEENRSIVDRVLNSTGVRLEGYRLAISEAYLADPAAGYAGAKLEYDDLRRTIVNLNSNLDGLGARYALSLPPTDGCRSRSLARPC